VLGLFLGSRGEWVCLLGARPVRFGGLRCTGCPGAVGGGHSELTSSLVGFEGSMYPSGESSSTRLPPHSDRG
jgi:hypothetical protein